MMSKTGKQMGIKDAFCLPVFSVRGMCGCVLIGAAVPG